MDTILHDAIVGWLAHGFFQATWWQIVLYTLLTTHLTIVSVTIFLHRAQAHRALSLSAFPSHLFRLWLWLGTGMNTDEFVGIHRKHHAKVDVEGDPHSPQVEGIGKLLREGTELYRSAGKRMRTTMVPDPLRPGQTTTELELYSRGTPDDWIERNLYTRFPWQGVGLMLILDLLLFGAIGATVWAVQMLWIPVMATGIINGIGHWWGYRNFDSPDASTNVSPWGILIGGEELHNNHHTYPRSAKLSVQRYEFDIGWLYIVLLEQLGMARVRVDRLPPLVELSSKERWDDTTVEAIIHFRYWALRWFDQTRQNYRHEKVDWEAMRDRLIRLWKEPDPVPGETKRYRSKTELLTELMHWREAALRSGSEGLRTLAGKLARLKVSRT